MKLGEQLRRLPRKSAESTPHTNVASAHSFDANNSTDTVQPTPSEKSEQHSGMVTFNRTDRPEPYSLSHGPANSSDFRLSAPNVSKGTTMPIHFALRTPELSDSERTREIALYMKMRDIFDVTADQSIPGNVLNKQNKWITKQTFGRLPTIKERPQFIAKRRENVANESDRLEQVFDENNPNNDLLINRQPGHQRDLPEDVTRVLGDIRDAYIETTVQATQYFDRDINKVQDEAAYKLTEYEGKQQDKLFELSGISPVLVEKMKESISKSNKYFWRWEMAKEVVGNGVALAVTLALRDKVDIPLSDGGSWLAGNVGYYSPLPVLAASDVRTQEETGYSSNPFAAAIEMKARKYGKWKRRLMAFGSRGTPEGLKNGLYNFIVIAPVVGAELYYITATYTAGLGHLAQAAWGEMQVRKARREGNDMKSLREGNFRENDIIRTDE